VNIPKRAIPFAEGLAAPWKGLGWLMSTPSAWPLAIVPVAVFSALLGGGGYLGVHFVESWLAARLTHAEGWAMLWHVVRVLGWLAALGIAVLVALALAQPISGPALEALAQKQGRALNAPPMPDTSFFAGLVRSLRVTLFGLLITIPIVVGLTIVELLMPPLAVVTVPVKFLVSAMMLSWDLLDYPLSLRAAGVGERLKWIRANFSAVLGFGVSIALIGLIPCAGLLFLPAGVAGATRLVFLSRSAALQPLA
jgi:CysZ protein